MIFGITGVKPDKLVVGNLNAYDRKVYNRLVVLAEKYFKFKEPTKVLSGMSLGWDQACVQACIQLGIDYEVVIACLGQEDRWSREYQGKYYEMLGRAKNVHVMSRWYSDTCYNVRNMHIVDNSDKIVSLGIDDYTKLMIRYAKINDKEVVDLWNSWEKYK